MTISEIKHIVSQHLQVPPSAVEVSHDSTKVSCSVDVTYDTLKKLTEAIGTTNVNFVYLEGQPGYSSWTPGTDGSFEIIIGIGASS